MPDANEYQYSDLDHDLAMKANGDVVAEFDTEAIKQSLYSILHTSPGERVMRPEFGISLSSFLFEPLDSFTADAIGQAIVNGINLYEPRVQVQRVQMVVNYSNQTYQATVYYLVVNAQILDTLHLILHKK